MTNIPEVILNMGGSSDNTVTAEREGLHELMRGNCSFDLTDTD